MSEDAVALDHKVPLTKKKKKKKYELCLNRAHACATSSRKAPTVLSAEPQNVFYPVCGGICEHSRILQYARIGLELPLSFLPFLYSSRRI